MVQVNEYIRYKIYNKGTKSDVIENDIKLSGVHHVYPISKPNTKLVNGFLKKIGKLPEECDFDSQFVVYFIDYTKAPTASPMIEDEVDKIILADYQSVGDF